MMIPSIDLAGGNAVQLVEGKTLKLDAGDPRPLARRFGRFGEVAVVDLDAALGRGSNRDTMRELLALAPCRVGGGIRTAKDALDWLDAGATGVVLGTAATPEVLSQLPRSRVVVALDARDGEVVVEGWQTGTGTGIVERMRELDGLAGGFLVTCVEREGHLGGVDIELAERLRDAAGAARLTIAGGIATADEIGELDRLGIDAQVGMALYTGKFGLADALWATLRSDREDGLVPTVVSDEHGVTLGLVWSDHESLDTAFERGVGAYHSRRRGLWIKGETSGATQELLSVQPDCDRDALCIRVRQSPPGFCHRSTWSCFAADARAAGAADQNRATDSGGLPALARRLEERRADAPAGSYTRKLFDDPSLLSSKLLEEAHELDRAATHEETVHEAADLLYFTLTRLARDGVSLAEVEAELDRRSLKVRRRPGLAKPAEETAP